MQVGIALPVMILAIIGLLEFGRVLWVRSTLQFAAEETARQAMISTGWNSASLTALLRSRIVGVDPAAVQVAVTPETVGGVAFVAISASLPQQLVSYLGINVVTVRGYARVPAAT
ncbi:MAG: pilus assembly protein [Alphaproteobacteria bacterium]|nr:pilus assembly protein [Alphaproteobacteria bacterium]